MGLTDEILAKASLLLEKTLISNQHCTREELVEEFLKINITRDNNRISHILMQAELDGLICSGASRGKKQTYALLEERVPKTKTLSKEEALAKLAQKYFQSHYPATLKDFIWWSGLYVADAKSALELIKHNLVSETIENQTYWFPNDVSINQPVQDSVYLLPAFDEFIISYKDRTATLDNKNHQRVISKNGIFWPTIVTNGQVTGLWKRTIKKNKVIIETDFFQPHNQKLKSLIESKAQSFASYLGLEAEVIHKII